MWVDGDCLDCGFDSSQKDLTALLVLVDSLEDGRFELHNQSTGVSDNEITAFELGDAIWILVLGSVDWNLVRE